MADWTLSNAIVKTFKSNDPQHPKVGLEFPEDYTGTEDDAQAFAENLLAGGARQAEIDALIAERDALQVQLAETSTKLTNLVDAVDAAEGAEDAALSQALTDARG